MGKMKPWEVFESDIALMNRAYHRDMKAKVEKTEPVVAMVQGKLRYVGKGPADFIGTINPRCPVVFDAKHTSKGVFHMTDDVFPLHQAQCLEAHHNMGAVAFILLQTKDGTWVLPWGRIRDWYWDGFRSLKVGDIGRGGIAVRSVDVTFPGPSGPVTVQAPDWLSAVREYV